MENLHAKNPDIPAHKNHESNGSVPYIHTASHDSSESTSDLALSNSFNDLHLSPYSTDGLSIKSASNHRPPSDGSDSIRLAYDDRRDSAESRGDITFPPQSETFAAFGPDPYADTQQPQGHQQHQFSYDDTENPSLPYLLPDGGNTSQPDPNLPPGVNAQGGPAPYHLPSASEQWPPGTTEQWIPPGPVPAGAPGQPPHPFPHPMYRPVPPGAAAPMYPPQQQFDQYGQPYYQVGPAYPRGPMYGPQGMFPPGMPPQRIPPGGIARAMSSNSLAPSQRPGMAPSRKGTTITTKRKPQQQQQQQQQRPMVSKEAIDEYRERIKDDEDPEAQFNFAKYLIEAARTLQQRPTSKSTSSEEKTLKKYRESLLSESLKRIKKLATQGTSPGKPPYADAQFFLANCLGHGSLGLQIDHEKAYGLYLQASKQNHASATYRVAVCNEIGTGTRKDASRAVWFYRKAAALGDTAGMYKLATVLLNGYLGQAKNPKEAVLWLKRAAAQADEVNPDALYYLGLLHEKPIAGTGLPLDELEAFDMYTNAAYLGYAPAQHKLGMAYEYGALGQEPDARKSIGFYSKAAEKGHAESELALSGWYLTGSDGLIQQSDKEAFLWAQKAARKALPKAEYALGHYYEKGIGTREDLEEAKRWYKRAYAQGNKQATKRLTEITLGDKKNKKKDLARPSRQQASEECIIV